MAASIPLTFKSIEANLKLKENGETDFDALSKTII
jgi:hypothetical protein